MGIRIFEKLLTLFFDIVAINMAFYMTVWLRYFSALFPESYNPSVDLAGYLVPSLVITGIWLVLFFFTGLYRTWYRESRIDEFFVVAKTILFGTFCLFLVTSAPQMIDFVQTGDWRLFLTRTKFATIFTYGGSMLFFATLIRFTIHSLLAFLFRSGLAVSRVLIVGANLSGERLVKEIHVYSKLGCKVVGFIDDDGRKKGESFAGYPVLGTYSDLPTIVKMESVAGLIIAHVSASPNEILKIMNYCSDITVTIYMVPSLVDVVSGHLKTHQIFGIPLLILLQDHMPGWEAQIKRLMDIAVSAGVLVVGAPVWLLVALVIRLNSPGPSVYSQVRVGRNGKNFTMYKFRSMYQDAEKRSGPKWATEDDPRITPVGRFIRKTRLDEIPQFWNVLIGEMSLVGPRPERPFFVEQLKQEIPWYVRRIKMTPGVTGWAQVKHKYDASIEDVKQKVLYDLYYFDNMSIILDLKIILQTFMVVLTGKGAH
ncbi:MAG: sugar transferase [Chitinispirillaceae bacterium]|jgi:exopolysaccharide biosynthesis polyprenyl glycosylphosphotransferase|nr:sugar transferase [Chitinispirillaceae bacterium]